MLRMMLVSPAAASTILGGKALAAILIGTSQAIVVLLVAALVPSIDLNLQYGVVGSAALAVVGIFLLNAMLCGFALFLATRIRTMQGFHLVMNLVLFPLLFFSGAFFPLEDLPLWLKILGYANPLTYAVDLLQLALYADGGDGYVGVPADLAVLTALVGLLALPAMRMRPASLALSGA
jgi:ABC-2 type transport system permease protein